jgi:hypothetical protein
MKRRHNIFRWGLLLLAAAGAFLIVSNFLIYSRLTFEQPVCLIAFKSLNETTFEAALQCQENTAQPKIFILNGDDWQLDARVIKWKATSNILGFDALYRLDRLAGRYHDVEQEIEFPRTVYALGENPSVDLWQILKRNQRWMPGLDAMYGSAVYAPMADGAHYEIKLSQSGLVARPINVIAEKAVRQWQ